MSREIAGALRKLAEGVGAMREALLCVAQVIELQPEPQGDRWLSLAEAAEHISVSEQFLRGIIESGQLRYHQAEAGRMIRVRRSDLDSFMLEHAPDPARRRAAQNAAMRAKLRVARGGGSQ